MSLDLISHYCRESIKEMASSSNVRLFNDECNAQTESTSQHTLRTKPVLADEM